MDILDAIVLGVVQGVTEFLPISSTGHLILVREFLGITADHGLAVDAVLQLATALAVLIYFRKDFAALARVGAGIAVDWCMRRISRSRAEEIAPLNGEERMLLFALVVGTIPAVIAGLLLEDYMETTFRSAELVAFMLIIGSFIFLAAEYVSRRYESQGIHNQIGPRQGLLIGLFQCLALIPGMSRSGATISGGLFLGLSREAAARFGFLLSLPIILGSGLKKALELGSEGFLSTQGLPLLTGALVAFVVGITAIHYLLRFLRNHTLMVFIVYRIALASLVLILFLNVMTPEM